ncbi:MAG: hypothetical protein MUP11_04345 [Anaerolineales bacterium]|nr:hypothetical protein [Anaerolineales bacterium]
MDQQLYLKYLKEYTLDALAHSGDNVSQAYDYLKNKAKPGILSKDRQEKRAALDRVKKIFLESRERSLYVVFKSLGFDELAKEKL